VSEARARVAIIGGGVLGCAIARELSLRGLAPWVLEQGPRIAEGVTSRNSGVVHGGVYYPPGSLKAESCNRGRELLYEWCERAAVPYRRCGKWVVGSRDDEEALMALYRNAADSGARVSLAGAAEVARELPGIRAEVAIRSPETGIVDPFELSRSLRDAAEEKGATFLLGCRVTGLERMPGGPYRIESGRGPLEADAVVNAAGLEADEIARLTGVERYRIHPCRGDYFRIPRPRGLETLVYPVRRPGAPGLGIHLTLGLDGSCRLGPDAVYVPSKTDFSAPADLAAKRGRFLEAARAYLPALREEDLSYDSCGIRPKLRAPDEPAEKDFVLSEDLPGLINLVGIESPGLTAALDLARRVAALL
jgi:L-2-hydroxyglutarate oxidase LhgO